MAASDHVGVRVLLVRHGETEWSANGRHTSRTDLPLLPAGRERAGAIADVLAGERFSHVFTSPLRRARETCALAGFGDVAEVFDDLREWDYGDYEGLTTPEIRVERPGWWLWTDGCPDGESPAEVCARADQVLARCLDAGAAHGVGGQVLLFAHGHILRVVTARWLEFPVAGGARFALKAGAVGVLGWERDTRVLERWNA